MTQALLEVAPARRYLVSTHGFNYRTERTVRWAELDLCQRYRYTARYPEQPENGAVLELPVRP
ncbi:hypothetical protein ACFWWM_41795 [Streptomyces sp. NPDC058682]|uniref:hypothetical protein n=1 Tax=Streptomyces sp. NPDC058682 TaxID=3346596 RepID=UPI00364961B3